MEVGGAVCGRPLAQRETIICHFFFPFFFSLLEKGIFVDQMKIVSTLHEYLFNNQCLTSEEKYWPVLSFKDKLNRIECISLVHASSISTLCRGDNFQKRNELVSSRFLRLGETRVIIEPARTLKQGVVPFYSVETVENRKPLAIPVNLAFYGVAYITKEKRIRVGEKSSVREFIHVYRYYV